MLAGQTRAMLGPDLPDSPPVGEVAQEGFVYTALALALHVRAHSWAEKDLGVLGVPGRNDVPHRGERGTADAFEALGRLLLPNASPEGWTATLVTDLARGDEKLEAAVKLGKYILHPTFLALTDDATRVVGEALHGLNVRRLHKLTGLLRRYAVAAEPSAESGPAPADDLVPECDWPVESESIYDPSLVPSGPEGEADVDFDLVELDTPGFHAPRRRGPGLSGF
ncbi:hypothetical protein ACFUTV_43025 [Streptomyces sp. NPDC057298]|uniref:hypothetical protein n=1 Tax=Streptomyces sp. NPDC057298 TaxID=3346091 RepID=UPI003624EF5D